MDRGIGMLHAHILARRAPEERRFRGRLNNAGRMNAELDLDARALHLRPGRPNKVLAVLYAPGTVGQGRPEPVRCADGHHARALELTVTPRDRDDIITMRVGCDVDMQRLGAKGGDWADVVVERAHANARWLVASAVSAAVIVGGCVMLSWGDPSARKGHYEGKTPEEIQRDLDTDVAWYAMEISVASRIVAPEGQTTIEARIENPSSNHCDQKVKVWETGREDDVLYESGAISPGEYLQTIELAHPLSVGTHMLTVSFQGYERTPTLVSDEGTLLGHDTFGARCAAEVTLEVTPAQA